MKPRDLALYGAIGGLTAAQTYVASGDLPHFLAPYIGIALAIFIAVKAKLSNGEQGSPPSVSGAPFVVKKDDSPHA